ncbi:Serine/threonine-protein kinase PknD [Candidatus Bilamarchaeum dharawalense]|uniref:Serine/threonine-protein kinase PknD n=1 Tax=Candidatus Bilamarchaeum dharawalense TaxID=2885759 RepID=A0A5E4LTT9_9ARCH|nr:Serine/threonine-protein kinase PknD [Candidatus Bilamarchaeum dharawalense]
MGDTKQKQGPPDGFKKTVTGPPFAADSVKRFPIQGPVVDTFGQTAPAPIIVDPLIGKTISIYKVVELIGSGGMGIVYKAQDPDHPDQFVAIKLMHPHLSSSEQARRMFFREIKTASKLDHPNLVKVFDFDELSHQLYLVMEYVHGKDLSNHLADNGKMPLDKALSTVVQVCEGMIAAHDKNVLHRDLKLENILLLDDPTGAIRVKIVDMGLAKILHPHAPAGDQVTDPGIVKGTPEYMPPEVIVGREADHRSDIYSIGVILYYLLCSKFPFESTLSRNDPDAPMQVVRKALSAKLVPPVAVDPSIPKEVSDIVAKAMEKKIEDRFQTLRELRQAIIDFAFAKAIHLDLPDGQTVPEPPPAPLIIVQQKTPKRFWWLVGALGIATAGLFTWNIAHRPTVEPPALVQPAQESYSVFIDSEPKNALVQMYETAEDGTRWLRDLGHTPFRNKLKGKTVVVISAPGHLPQFLDVDSENTQFPTIVLPKIPPSPP